MLNDCMLSVTRTPKAILVISVPGLGDALLTTPLIRSLKQAYPEANIDLLVRRGRASIFNGNSDVRAVLEFDYDATIRSYISMVMKIFRRYDLAVAASSSDRSVLCTLYAAPQRIGLLPPHQQIKSLWKQIVLNASNIENGSHHRALEILDLTRLLGIKKHYDIICPQTRQPLTGYASRIQDALKDSPYCAVHPWSRGLAKNWSISKWRKIVGDLINSGFCVLITGGSSPEEIRRVEQLVDLNSRRVVNGCGQLSFSELSIILAGADLYIGPDTVTTHLAAALGVRTFALFGPSDPAVWGPLPAKWQGNDSPYTGSDQVQNAGNVTVLRGPCECLTPHRACKLSQNGEGRCLASISSSNVLRRVKAYLNQQQHNESPVLYNSKC